MSILERSVEQKHAVVAVANTVGINLAATAKAPDAINFSNTAKPVDVGQHVGSAVSANRDAGQKLGQIADIKHSLAQQMPDGQGGEQHKSALMSENADPQSSGMVRGAVYAGLTALGIAVPAVGLAAAAVEAVRFATAPVAQHAGLTHAAIDAAPSAFKTGGSLSDKGKKDPIVDSYTDSQGQRFDRGYAVASAPPPQMTTPAGHGLELGIHVASRDVIGRMGAEKVKKDLGSMSAVEEKLELQVGSSAKQLQELGMQPQQMANLGVRPPAMG